VVDSARTTACAVAEFLRERDLLAPDQERTLDVLVTDMPKSFEAVAARLLGEVVGNVTQVDL
jgi:glutamate racemase